MARKKSLADLSLQRFRIKKAGASASRMKRVERAYNRYKDNILQSLGVSTINPVSNFLNGTIMRARTVKVSRSVYMGTKAKGMNQP